MKSKVETLIFQQAGKSQQVKLNFVLRNAIIRRLNTLICITIVGSCLIN